MLKKVFIKYYSLWKLATSVENISVLKFLEFEADGCCALLVLFSGHTTHHHPLSQPMSLTTGTGRDSNRIFFG